ncbi:clostripain-related cysteine peptidase [Pseudothermotoga sp.]|nr:clostripain-related cysteine peptidase [Pseudothermotoga sp.]MDW8139236.1 clostripain-related cysteine peptidase [Pseudothermotoga sp.]
MKKLVLLLSILFALFLVSCTNLSLTRIKVLLPGNMYAGKPFIVKVGVMGPFNFLLSNVDVEINGQTYRTDSSGYAHVQFLFLKAGSYKIGVKYEEITQEIVLNVKPASWLVIGWIGADNNLSSYVDQDIQEMKKAAKDVAVILLVDHLKSEKSDGIYALSNEGEFLQIETLNELNSGCRDTFSWFIKKYQNCDAVRKSLIIWNHGTAWNDVDPYKTKGISYDDTDKDFLTIDELKGVLEGTHWDVLGFDACLMASVEVLYELKNSADFFLAAPGEIPSTGWDYSFLGEISNSDSKSFCQKAVQFWRAHYNNSKFRYSLNAWEKEKFTEAVKQFADRLKSIPPEVQPEVLPICAIYSLNPRLCDFGEVLASFEWSDVLKEFQRACLSEITTQLHLNVFFPQSKDQLDNYREMYSKLSFASQTGWLNWLDKYFSTILP